MSFDVELLFRLRKFSVVTERFNKIGSFVSDQFELWQDPSGPLRVLRVGSVEKRHFRVLLDENVAVDVLPDRKLVVHATLEMPKSTIEHFVADQVMPRVLAQDGEFVLHSAAIRFGGGAILILGTSGSGKSTLAASFQFEGYVLMGDDAAIIATEGVPSATALYASLRLFPDSIAALLPDDIVSEDVAHYSEKQRLSIQTSKGLENESVPLIAIFILAEPTDDAICVTRLSVANACMALLSNSFALDPTDAKGAHNRLQKASELAGRIPAYALEYPRDYTRLREVRQAIVGRLN
ncbi:MAG: hypothetical protein V4696_00260 [Pseudomonadota bacterium]